MKGTNYIYNDFSHTTVPIAIGSVWDKGYRYGFNGEEIVNEIAGQGNVYDLGERHYESRIARMFSKDPLEDMYVWQSTYAYCYNNPIWIVDYKGMGGKPTEKHIVQKGESLSSLAKKNNITVEAIKDANKQINWNDNKRTGNKKNWIYSGETLNIPTNVVTGNDIQSNTVNRSNVNQDIPNINNKFKITIYGSDVMGQGVGSVKIYSTSNNPSGLPSFESKSSGWSVGAGLGIDINLFTGFVGNIEFDKVWLKNLKPQNITDIANSCVFTFRSVGSIIFYGSLVVHDKKTNQLVSKVNMIGGGFNAGISGSKTKGGFKETHADTFLIYQSNILHGKGDTASMSEWIKNKKTKKR